MQIIGPTPLEAAADPTLVHTIDVWYSAARRRWLVQRLDGAGGAIGSAYRCTSKAEALACLAAWKRRHPEAHLTSHLA